MPSNAASQEFPAKPSWFDIPVGWNEALPGLPSFASLSWIERWQGLDSADLRRLHAAVTQSRGELLVGTWWPQAAPTLSDIPYLLARTMGEPAAFAELVRAYAIGGTRAGTEPSTLFGKLREAFRKADAEADAKGMEDIYESHVLANLLEDPVEVTAYFTRCPTGADGHDIACNFVEDPLLASLFAWMRVHFPDCAAQLDRRLAWTPESEAVPDAADAPATSEVAPRPASPAPEVSPAPEPLPATAPVPAPYVEGEVEEITREVHAALVDVAEHAVAASASATPLRAAVNPVVLAVLRAARGARVLERHLEQPYDASGLLASLAESSARAAHASKRTPDPLPEPPLLVSRPAYPRLDALAKELNGTSCDLHALFERAGATSRMMAETLDFTLATSVAEIQSQITAQADAFASGLASALAEMEAARYVAPVAAPRPVPAARPSAAPRPVAPAVSVAPSAPAHPVEVLSSAVFDLGAYDEKVFKAALALCMPHLSGPDGLDLPDDPVHNPVFSRTGAAGQTVRTLLVGSGDAKTWSAVRHEDDASQPGRRIALEIALQAHEGALRLGFRVTTSAASGSFEGERMAHPLAAEIAAALPCAAGPLPHSAKPVELTVQNARDTFEAYVLSPRRVLPVVAVSLDKAGRTSLVSVKDLAIALAGVAHVLVVPADPGKVLTTAHSQAWSVYNGAVRVYQTKANTQTDDPARHKVIRADYIARVNANCEDGDAPFERHLVDQILREGGHRYAEAGLPTFDVVEAQAAEAARRLAEELAYGSDELGLAEIYAQETDAANRRAAEAQALADHLAEEAGALKDERDDVWARNANLVARVEMLTTALAVRNATGTQPPAPAAPATIEEICRFAETDLGSHVIVLPKAIRETRKTANLNVSRLYEGLVLLRDVYAPMRRGEITREAFDAAARAIRYDESSCFSDSNVDRFPGYTADWNGTRYRLNRHLKWGVGSTDTMIRIYFHYDEGSQCVIVGHMPSHLPN